MEVYVPNRQDIAARSLRVVSVVFKTPASVEEGNEGTSTHQDDRQDDRPPRPNIAVTVAAATTHVVCMVVGSPASPVAVSGASGMGIPKAAAPGCPLAGRGRLGDA